MTTFAAAATILAMLAGMLVTPVHGLGETDAAASTSPAGCACTALQVTESRFRRNVPRTCRLCGGMLSANAATGNIEFEAPAGGEVVIKARLTALKGIVSQGPLGVHTADGQVQYPDVAETLTNFEAMLSAHQVNITALQSTSPGTAAATPTPTTATTTIDHASELASVVATVSLLSARLDTAEAENVALKTRMGAVEAKNTALTTEMGAVEAGNAMLVRKNTELSTRLDTAKADRGAIKASLNSSNVALKTRVGEVEAKNTALTTKLGAAEEQAEADDAMLGTLEGGQEQVWTMIREHTAWLVDTSAIFSTGGGDVRAVIGWLQDDIPAFKGTTVALTRCYSMAKSGDAGTSQGFHTACDYKDATVTVVKTKEGYIFGGVSDKSWTSSYTYKPNPTNAYKSSQHAFLFCINCAGAGQGAQPSQIKLNGKKNVYALGHYSDSGPIFGGGSDLEIANQPGGTSTSSYSNLGSSYTCPAGAQGSAACKNYLAGSQFFTVADYETFLIG